MNWVDKEISKHYRKKNLCPFCNEKLIYIIRGFPRKSDIKKLNENNINFILGGCCIEDESIEPCYFCKNCNKGFKSDLSPIN